MGVGAQEPPAHMRAPADIYLHSRVRFTSRHCSCPCVQQELFFITAALGRNISS
jgi:hypothetical protein